MRGAALILLIGLVASPASAQPAAAPAGEVLSSAPQHITTASDQPAAPAPQAAPTAPPPAAQSTPAGLSPPSAAAPTRRPNVPESVDQTGVSNDDPPSYGDLNFDARIHASVAAAEGLQGPMDGRWTLYDADGKPLYVFMFVDPAGGRGALEAAWRDPRRVRGADDLGVVDSLQRNRPSLTLTFAPHAGAPATQVQLQGDPGGAWRGQMSENGATLPVVLRRP